MRRFLRPEIIASAAIVIATLLVSVAMVRAAFAVPMAPAPMVCPTRTDLYERVTMDGMVLTGQRHCFAERDAQDLPVTLEDLPQR